MEFTCCGNDAVVILHDLFYDGQSDAGAPILFFIVKLLEYFKNTVVKFGLEADPVIRYGNVAILLVGRKLLIVQGTTHFNLARDDDMGRDLRIREFECVTDEIKHELAELKPDDICRAHLRHFNNRALFIDAFFQFSLHLLDDDIEVGVDEYPFGGINPRECKQILDEGLHPFGGFLYSTEEFSTLLAEICTFAFTNTADEGLNLA